MLRITRDSVAAGDDIDAPHEYSVEISSAATALDVFNAMLDADYLPRVTGGLATWILRAGKPLAVIAQQWDAPRIFDDAVGARIPDALHVQYCAQRDPERVFAEIVADLR